MFFSWFTKNKNFNKNKGISGQIMPFLLVIIAIFLGAAMTVVKLGRDVINITCTENAMDDCSLGAASIWSEALNMLMQSNAEWKADYDTMFSRDIKLPLIMRKLQLIAGLMTMDIAEQSIHTADVPGVADEPNCECWDKALNAETQLKNAAETAKVAANSFMSATDLAMQVMSGVKDMKESRRADYADIRAMMAEAYAAAQEAGAEYAQINIEECLIRYPDGSTETDGGITGESYSSASVYVPNISSYQLQITPRNNPCPYEELVNPFPPDIAGCHYPSIPAELYVAPPGYEDLAPPSLDEGDTGDADPLGSIMGQIAAIVGPSDDMVGSAIDMADRYAIRATVDLAMSMQMIQQNLLCAAYEMQKIYRLSCEYVTTDRCTEADHSFISIGGNPYDELRERARIVYSDLEKIIQTLGQFKGMMFGLIHHNQEINDAFDPTAPRVISSSGGDTGDAMIVGIDSLTFEPGCISCSGGGQTSGAGYGGGSMADDGTGSYTPGLSDYCPSAEWGSSGTTGTAEDAGCGGGGGPFSGSTATGSIGGGASGGSH